VLGCVGDHILQEFIFCIETDLETTKLPDHPKQNLGGEGASDRLTTAAKSLYRPIFLNNDFDIAIYQSNLSTGPSH
jgi:hypothetical protein